MTKLKTPLISESIFRAYDIRGVVDETLTPSSVTAIGQAIGTAVLEAGESSVVIARDGRLSGPTFMQALSQGILSTGCDVVNIGMNPTPVLYFATQHLKIASGVMITGSHNPVNYNGFKIMIKGNTLYNEGISALYDKIITQQFKKGQGRLSECDVTADYLRLIKEDVTLERPLKIVVDCGNGVAGSIAPELYQALGCEVIPLFCEVDGHFPNHHPDPGQPANLQDLIRAVKQHNADIGLAFDGDGDRLGVVDDSGNIIWADRQLMLFSKDVLFHYPKASIIFDVKCTRHVANKIAEWGGQPLMWKTGHSLIKAKMRETGALLAGEMSGHLFFKDRWYGFDDALYAGARLLELISKESRRISTTELFATLPDSINTPELHIGVCEKTKFESVEKLISLARFQNAIISTIDGLRVDFQDGFGLVRPSNTTPNLILRFEGDTVAALERIQTEFRALLKSVEPDWILPF